ncbi:hypothetical protein KW796_01490 [Candidatus Parcubacteria bacterium]|nr:hypothetical protein [Candidatus Parcubacteria bacterium]
MYTRSSLFKALFVIIFFVAPVLASAATLFISPESDSYAAGKTFSIRVRVSSPQAINAVSGSLTFPTDKLQVTSVSKTGSILTLWVADPSYSNSDGKVSFEGVVPNPGWSGTGGTVATVSFRVVGSGSAKVSYTAASVLANDGNGTELCYNCGLSATYTLGGAPAPVVPAEEVEPSGTPGAPNITSSSHPVQSKWYGEEDAKFSWTNEPGVTATRVLLGKSANSTPTAEYTPPITNREIDNIEDGIWYFHVQNKNSKGWGSTAHYMIKVDTTDPDSFVMKEVARPDDTDPRVRLSLSASDDTSGIKSFGIQVDKGEMQDWVEDGTGIYVTDPLPPGEHTIFARAYDEAGNFATASVNVEVKGIPAPKITSYTDKISGSAPIIVRGTALPNSIVRVTLTKGGSLGGIFGSDSGEISPFTKDTKSDDSGDFSLSLDTKGMESGAYDLTAIAIDRRGAQSEPTAPKTVLINAGWLRSIGSTILTVLAIAVPVLALLFLLFIIFMRGFHTVRMTNRKFRAELHNIEHLVDQSFVLLKEDVEDSIRLLEKTKSRRKLTEEEEAIIDRLRQNLRDAEKVIHGQVRRIEKEIG